MFIFCDISRRVSRYLNVGNGGKIEGDGIETGGVKRRFKALWSRRFGSSERLRLICWMILVKLMG